MKKIFKILAGIIGALGFVLLLSENPERLFWVIIAEKIVAGLMVLLSIHLFDRIERAER